MRGPAKARWVQVHETDVANGRRLSDTGAKRLSIEADQVVLHELSKKMQREVAEASRK